MKKAILSAFVLLVASPAAFAVEVLLPNGGFETDPSPSGGFTQSITNWTVSFSGTPAGSLPSSEQSGIFTSFGRFSVAPESSQFVALTNLGGGTVTMTSGASGARFAVNDRLLGFRYVYMTNDDPNASTHDAFTVQIDFFDASTGGNQIGSITQVISAMATDNNTQAGFSPLGGTANNSSATYNDAVPGGTDFNFVAVDIEQYLGSFARVSFIVDNAGPAGGTNNNGLGVSAILLDGVLLTPEPSAIALFAFGAAGLGGFAWRRRAAKKKPAA
jgi:PEP-CTERM motif